MIIIAISALQILDSRGNPTLQVSVTLEDGSKGTFQVPSGASTGIHEAHELRDNEERFKGKSVLKAVNNIEQIKKHILERDFTQQSLDTKLIELDGTPNKELLGANSILGISIAFAKASAIFYNLPLYEYLYRLQNGINFKNKTHEAKAQIHLFANIINGGLHAGNELNIQEFMIIPTLETLQEKVRACSEIYQTLKENIGKKYGKSNTAVGDEGGFAPTIKTAKEALDLLDKAVEETGYSGKVFYAMDAAASDFYNPKTKKYEVEKGKKLTFEDLTHYYNGLVQTYPLISIEDPMAEDDFEGFSFFRKNIVKLTKVNPLNKKKEVLIVGDDLLVTNPERIKLAQDQNLCNSLLLKINQIGTLTESLEAFSLASQKGWHTIVSHRSGETTDDFISDLSVALKSSIKLGAPARGERVAKYNRLLNIYK